MSPYDRARQLYLDRPGQQSFEWYVQHFQRHGFCFATPRFFIMGRPVPSWGEPSDIVDCAVLFDHERCDCWFVHCLAGQLSEAWAIMPWPLPLIGFERNRGGKDLCFVATAAIKRLSLPAA